MVSEGDERKKKGRAGDSQISRKKKRTRLERGKGKNTRGPRPQSGRRAGPAGKIPD